MKRQLSSYRCKLVRESKNVERERVRRERVVLGHRVGNQLASKQVKALGFLYPWATATVELLTRAAELVINSEDLRRSHPV